MNNGISTQAFLNKQSKQIINNDAHSANSELSTVVPAYTGSNGYTTSIHSSPIFHTVVAHVITPQNKFLEISSGRIINGLTGQAIAIQQLHNIANKSESFKAIYLSETQKVYIWPHLRAAAIGDRVMTNDKLNTFIKQDKDAVTKMLMPDKDGTLAHPNFRIPGTNKTVGELGGFHHPRKEATNVFISQDRSVTIHYDNPQNPKGSHKEAEPAHVCVMVWTKGSEKQIKTNYPINPKDPRWEKIKQVQEPINQDPRHEPCPKDKGGGKGPGGGGGGSGGKGGSGGAGGGSTTGFNNNLNQNGLTKSYNSTNPNNPLMDAQGVRGEIGGVAVYNPNAILLNMQHCIYDLTADGYWLSFPSKTNQAPFSDQQLRQIIRELAQNIYIHQTLPFYSLHFTKEGTLYSVIHPAYQNTLVGKVIGMLDYFMKGYLNGGYFAENDLKDLATRKNQWIHDYDNITPRQKAIEDLYNQEISNSEYVSLTELLEQYQIKQYNALEHVLGKEELAKLQQRFQISFRIIAKEDSIEKSGSTLLFNGAFDVFYTIELHKGGIANLEQYKKSNEYQILDQFCKMIARDIKEKLPLLSICQEYFAMLEVICGISYYFSSLKRQELMPNLNPITANPQDKCLGMFPPYPKTKIQMEPLKHTLWDFMQGLDAKNKKELGNYLTQVGFTITPQLQSAVATSITRMLPSTALKFKASDLNQLVIILLNNALQCINQFKVTMFTPEMDRGMQTLEENIKQAKVNLKTHTAMFEDIEKEYKQAKTVLKPKEKENISSQLWQIDQQAEKNLRQIDASYTTQKMQIEETRINYGETITYNGKKYHSYDLFSLKTDMRKDLDQKIKELKIQLDKEVGSSKIEARQEIKEHWSNNSDSLDIQYQGNIAKIHKHIASVKKNLSEMEAKYQKCIKIRTNLRLNNLDSSIAQEIELSIPAMVRKLGIGDFTQEDKSLVQISGGTGFSLTNLDLSLDTPLSTHLNLNLSSDVITKFTANNHNMPVEKWQNISVKGKPFQSFYLKHSNLNLTTQIEESLILPEMAKSKDEKLLIQLAAQKPNPQQLAKIQKLLLESNPPVNLRVTDSYGNNVIHLAAMNNNSALIALLAKPGVNIRKSNRFGNTPVHIAAMYGHEKVLSALQDIDEGSVQQLTNNDESALYLAVLHHKLTTVKLLLTYGLDSNETGINGSPLIYTALYNNSLETTNYLLDLPQINIKFQMENGDTLLHLAARLNQVEIIRKLLASGADTKLTNRSGNLALHDAIEQGYLESVKLLIESDNTKNLVETENSAGLTPLLLALEQFKGTIAEYLLNKGANSHKLVNGANALSYAIKARQLSIAETILNREEFNLAQKNTVNRQNFLLLCQLGLWELCRLINEKNPQCLLVELEAPAKNVDEVSCYLDYLVKAKETSTFKDFVLNNDQAIQYLNQNRERLYRIALRFGSMTIIKDFKSLGMDNPYGYSSQLFKETSPEADPYREYDLLQFAIRTDLSRIYHEYIDAGGIGEDNHGKPWSIKLSRFTPELYLTPYDNNQAIDLEHPTPDGKSLLYLACENGDQKLIEELIDAGANLVAPNGKHIFYALIEHNHYKIIRALLIRQQLRINNIIVDNKTQMRAIDLACCLGNLDSITTLCGYGAKLEQKDSNGKLPIFYAIENHAYHVIRLLFKYDLGDLTEVLSYAILHYENEVIPQILNNRPAFKREIVKIGESLFKAAITSGNLGACLLLLDLGINFDQLECLELAVKHKQPQISALIQKVELTSLKQFAILSPLLLTHIKADNSTECAAELTRANLNINQQFIYIHEGDNYCLSLLDIAILENKPQLIKYLLAHGCDPYQSNSLGGTAVHLLMRLSDALFVVNLIERFNLDSNIRGKLDCLPLHIAILAQNNALIDYLLARTQNLYAEMDQGKTIMTIAIEQNMPELVRRLIKQYSYDIHHKNSKLETPLAQALTCANLEIAQYLCDLGADINSLAGFRLQSMLHYAVKSEDIKIVQYALKKMSNSKIADTRGMLALHLAAKLGLIAITELLSESQPILLALSDKRGRDVTDFALIHQKEGLSAYLSQKYGTSNAHILKDQEIDFKKYKSSGRSQLELAIIAGDSLTITNLLRKLKPEDTKSIKQAIRMAGASDNPQIFFYVINQLWDGQDLKVLRLALLESISNNRVSNLQALIPLCGPNIVFEDGTTPLIVACLCTAVESLRALLDYYQDKGIEPAVTEIHRSLQMLIKNSKQNSNKNNNLLMARMITENCDNDALNQIDGSGNTLLHEAVEQNQAQILALLIMKGCCDRKNYISRSALETAERLAYDECSKYLKLAQVELSELDDSPDAADNDLSSLKPSPPVDKSAVNAPDNTPLNYLNNAQGNVDYAILKWLCKFKDVNSQNNKGQTALHLALKTKNKAVLEILLEAGASLAVRDTQQRTALDYAKVLDKEGFHEIYQTFIELAFNTRRIDTLFEELCSSGIDNNKMLIFRNDISDKLISEVPDQLYNEIKDSKRSIYSLLIYRNGLSGATKEDDSILQLAIALGVDVFYSLLLSHGAKLDPEFNLDKMLKNVNTNGDNLLHSAVRHNNLAKVTDLLKLAQYDFHATNNEGFNPTTLALVNDNEDILKQLLEAGGKVSLTGIPSTVVHDSWQHYYQELDRPGVENILNATSPQQLYLAVCGYPLSEITAMSQTTIFNYADNLTPDKRKMTIEMIKTMLILSQRNTNEQIYALLQKSIMGGLTDIAANLASIYNELADNHQTPLARAAAQNDVEVFEFLLANGHNPYLAFTRRISPRIQSTAIVDIYNLWYEEQLDSLIKLLGYKLHFKNTAEYLGMLDVVLAKCGEECVANPNDLNQQCWNSLFVFMEMSIRKMSSMTSQMLLEHIRSHCAQYHSRYLPSIEKVLNRPFISKLADLQDQRSAALIRRN